MPVFRSVKQKLLAWSVGLGFLSITSDNPPGLPSYMTGPADDVEDIENAHKKPDQTGTITTEEAQRLAEINRQDSLYSARVDAITGGQYKIKVGDNLHVVPGEVSDGGDLILAPGMAVEEIVWSQDQNKNTHAELRDKKGKRVAAITLHGLCNPLDIDIHTTTLGEDGSETISRTRIKSRVEGIMQYGSGRVEGKFKGRMVHDDRNCHYKTEHDIAHGHDVALSSAEYYYEGREESEHLTQLMGDNFIRMNGATGYRFSAYGKPDGNLYFDHFDADSSTLLVPYYQTTLVDMENGQHALLLNEGLVGKDAVILFDILEGTPRQSGKQGDLLTFGGDSKAPPIKAVPLSTLPEPSRQLLQDAARQYPARATAMQEALSKTQREPESAVRDSTLALITRWDGEALASNLERMGYIDWDYSQSVDTLKVGDAMELPGLGITLRRAELVDENGLKPEYHHLHPHQVHELLGGRGAYIYEVTDREQLRKFAFHRRCPQVIEELLDREGLALPQEVKEALNTEWMPPQYPEFHDEQVLANATVRFDRLEEGSYQTRADDYTLDIIQFQSDNFLDRGYDAVMEMFDPGTKVKINLHTIKDFVEPKYTGSIESMDDPAFDAYMVEYEKAYASWRQHIVDTRAAIGGPALLAFTNHSGPDGLQFAKAGATPDHLYELLTRGAQKAESRVTGKPLKDCKGFRTDILAMTCYNAHHADAFEKNGVEGSVFIAMNEANEEFIPTRAVKTRKAIKEYLNSSLCYQQGISAYDFMLTNLLEGGAGEWAYGMVMGKEPAKEYKDKHRGIPQMVVAGGDQSIMNVQYLATKRFQRFSSEGGSLFTPEEVVRIKASPVIQHFVGDIEAEIAKMEKLICDYNKLGDVPKENESFGKFLTFSVVATQPINGMDNAVANDIRATVFADKKVTPGEKTYLGLVDAALEGGLAKPTDLQTLQAIQKSLKSEPQMRR